MSGEGIAIRVDHELVQRLRRKGLSGGGTWRVHDGRWMHVHDQDRLARIARFGEGVQIGKIKPCVSTWKSKVRTGVMMRHASCSLLSRGSLLQNFSAA